MIREKLQKQRDDIAKDLSSMEVNMLKLQGALTAYDLALKTFDEDKQESDADTQLELGFAKQCGEHLNASDVPQPAAGTEGGAVEGCSTEDAIREWADGDEQPSCTGG